MQKVGGKRLTKGKLLTKGHKVLAKGNEEEILWEPYWKYCLRVS